jgi:hypothetical protein
LIFGGEQITSAAKPAEGVVMEQLHHKEIILLLGKCGGGLAVIFQHVVPIADDFVSRSSRGGAKVRIGCNDLQGADLSRRLLHGPVLEWLPDRPVGMGTTS